MTEIASLVLFARQLDRTAAFYRAIGLPLADEDHGDGPRHLAGEIGPVHFAIYAADHPEGRSPKWRQPGSSFSGFYVASLDDTLTALADAPVLAGHQERPWGCRAVVEDPDGRAVEINQRGHCAGA
jgi:lactoylglutathione lyase